MHDLGPKQIKKILIRTTNWIGDAVMTTPAMGAVRRAFPDSAIVVAANPAVAELLSPHPDCDRVVVFDKQGEHKGASGFLRFCAALRKEKFDLAVLFQNAIEAAIIARLAGIPRRAGYRSDGRGFLLTHGVSVGNSERGLHHTRYYLHMLNELGIGIEGSSPSLYCTLEEKAWASQVLPGDGWIAVNPGAAYGSAKRWIPERFAEVGDRVAEELEARIVLIGGRNEVGIGREIEAGMHHRPINLVGATSVRQMMAVLSRCRLMVTNDSGPMHVAAALGVPIVALFGPTDHTTTSPFSESCRIVRKPVDCAPCLLRHCPTDHHCMEAITVEDVMDAVRLISGR